MPESLTRRDFLKAVVATGAGVALGDKRTRQFLEEQLFGEEVLAQSHRAASMNQVSLSEQDHIVFNTYKFGQVARGEVAEDGSFDYFYLQQDSAVYQEIHRLLGNEFAGYQLNDHLKNERSVAHIDVNRGSGVVVLRLSHDEEIVDAEGNAALINVVDKAIGINSKGEPAMIVLDQGQEEKVDIASEFVVDELDKAGVEVELGSQVLLATIPLYPDDEASPLEIVGVAGEEKRYFRVVRPEELQQLQINNPDPEFLIPVATQEPLTVAMLPKEASEEVVYSVTAEEAMATVAQMDLISNAVERGLYPEYRDFGRIIASRTNAAHEAGIPGEEDNPFFNDPEIVRRSWNLLLAWAVYGERASYEQILEVDRDPEAAIALLEGANKRVWMRDEAGSIAEFVGPKHVVIDLAEFFRHGRIVGVRGAVDARERGVEALGLLETGYGSAPLFHVMFGDQTTPNTVYYLFNYDMSEHASNPEISNYRLLSTYVTVTAQELGFSKYENGRINWEAARQYWFRSTPGYEEFYERLMAFASGK